MIRISQPGHPAGLVIYLTTAGVAAGSLVMLAPMRGRSAGWGCIGLPGMIAAFAFLAFATTVEGWGLIVGGVAVVLVYLVVGMAMTFAKKGDEK